MSIQAYMDAMSKSWEDQRSKYHLTLGSAIKAMSEHPEAADWPVEYDIGGSPAAPHSYRGYYSDLSFKAIGQPLNGAAFLKLLNGALGATFEGYKGGDYTMHERTPLWTAHYGSTGRAIIGINFDGKKVTLATKNMDD